MSESRTLIVDKDFKQGRLFTCEICGHTEFVEYSIDQSSDYDVRDIYDCKVLCPPEDWTYNLISSLKLGYVCPYCSAYIKRSVNHALKDLCPDYDEFMKNREVDNGEH